MASKPIGNWNCDNPLDTAVPVSVGGSKEEKKRLKSERRRARRRAMAEGQAVGHTVDGFCHASDALRQPKSALSILRARNRGYYVEHSRNALRAHYVHVMGT